jgi:hypothetical protein
MEPGWAGTVGAGAGSCAAADAPKRSIIENEIDETAVFFIPDTSGRILDLDRSMASRYSATILIDTPPMYQI